MITAFFFVALIWLFCVFVFVFVHSLNIHSFRPGKPLPGHSLRISNSISVIVPFNSRHSWTLFKGVKRKEGKEDEKKRRGSRCFTTQLFLLFFSFFLLLFLYTLPPFILTSLPEWWGEWERKGNWCQYTILSSCSFCLLCICFEMWLKGNRKMVEMVRFRSRKSCDILRSVVS